MDQTVAASSPAEAVDVFNGQEPSLAEYMQYQQTKELPERFKPAEKADPAPATEEEQSPAEPEKAEDAPDSDPEETQEHPQKGAEKRIKQLLAQKKELERKLAEAAKQDVKTESSTAKPQQAPPQNYQEWRKAFKPADWVAEYAKQNPEASYEDATAAMADFLGDVRDGFKEREKAFAEQKRKWDSQLSEAAQKYENFDEEKSEFAARIVQNAEIPFALKELLNDSDVLPHLIHVIAEDEAELAKFEALAKQSPTKAARYIAKVEAAIEEELNSGAEQKPEATERNEKGQFTKAAPPAKKQTQAPKPPTPVGGGSARVFDVNDDQTDINEWLRGRQAQLARK